MYRKRLLCIFCHGHLLVNIHCRTSAICGLLDSWGARFVSHDLLYLINNYVHICLVRFKLDPSARTVA